MSIVSSYISVKVGNSVHDFQRAAWTGGASPSAAMKKTHPFKEIRRFFFRELLGICGGLDLWKCAGTGSMERARIFWNEATLDAWATLREHGRRN